MSICVIGAAILDINAKSKNPIIPQDSNIGTITLSCGGVGRNIAENLARLKTDVKLIAPLGDDLFGQKLLNDCQRAGIDMSCCQICPGGLSPAYVAVLDQNGEMNVAVVGDAVSITFDHILKHAETIRNSQVILIDTNLHKDVINSLPDIFSGKDFYLDTISVNKAARVKDIAGKIHTLKMNRLEASFLAGFNIEDEDSLERAARHFLNQGTKRLVISLGQEGFYYRTQEEKIRCRPAPIIPVNATGAGDALMAGITYCSLHNKSGSCTVSFAQAMAKMALMSESAVNVDISPEKIEEVQKIG